MVSSNPTHPTYETLTIDPRRVTIKDHWPDDPEQRHIEQDLFLRNPNDYINDLHRALRHSREINQTRELGARGLRAALRDSEKQIELLVNERAVAQRTIQRLDNIRAILDRIVQHQGRNCAARDICSDHDDITMLAKVARDYLSQVGND